jgi:hypothetical protein
MIAVGDQVTSMKEMPMCHRTQCRACKKVTWAGCGQHRNEVMREVPKAERCTCTAQEREAARKSTFLGRLFG